MDFQKCFECEERNAVKTRIISKNKTLKINN